MRNCRKKNSLLFFMVIALLSMAMIFSACSNGEKETTEETNETVEIEDSEESADEEETVDFEETDEIEDSEDNEESEDDEENEGTNITGNHGSQSLSSSQAPLTDSSSSSDGSSAVAAANTSGNNSETGSRIEQSQETSTPSFPGNLDAASRFNKIIIVSVPSSSSTSGTLTYYRKSGNTWSQVMSTSCFVGWDGVGGASEYRSATPNGLFTFTMLFGNSSNPGTIMSYHYLDDNDYWCGEQYYNQFVDEDVTDHSGCSKENDEQLRPDGGTAYEYCAAFSYNISCTPGRGSAFFLHCSEGIPTEGCVSVSRSNMITLMQNIDASTCIIIDTESNISRY